MQALLDLSSPTDSATNLRRFYDSMENYIRGLEASGKKQDTYGDLLIPIVMAKIPTSIKHNIIRENGTNNWDVEQKTWRLIQKNMAAHTKKHGGSYFGEFC